MQVLDHLIKHFPETLIEPTDRAILADMPADSNCGADCVLAIEAAAPIARLIRKAHGPYAVPRVQPIGTAVKDLCLTYICG